MSFWKEGTEIKCRSGTQLEPSPCPGKEHAGKGPGFCGSFLPPPLLLSISETHFVHLWSRVSSTFLTQPSSEALQSGWPPGSEHCFGSCWDEMGDAHGESANAGEDDEGASLAKRDHACLCHLQTQCKLFQDRGNNSSKGMVLVAARRAMLERKAPLSSGRNLCRCPVPPGA